MKESDLKTIESVIELVRLVEAGELVRKEISGHRDFLEQHLKTVTRDRDILAARLTAYEAALNELQKENKEHCSKYHVPKRGDLARIDGEKVRVICSGVTNRGMVKIYDAGEPRWEHVYRLDLLTF